MGLFHDYFLLHLLLNATYVAIGMVAGLFLAWATRVERRYRIRWQFVRVLLLAAIALSLLITNQLTDAEHFWASIVSGIVVGFLTAFLSRRQAQSDPPGGTRGESSRRPR